jgi:hypothetical protein
VAALEAVPKTTIRGRLDTAPHVTSAQRLYEAAGCRRAGERVEKGPRDSRCEYLYELPLRA